LTRFDNKLKTVWRIYRCFERKTSK